MLSNNLLVAVVVSVFVVLIVVVFVVAFMRQARWETALDGLARALKGRFTKGRWVQLAYFPGQVEAKVAGRDVTVEQETLRVGGSGNSREVKRLAISIGTSQSKPEFLGPASARGEVAEVNDYGGGGGGGAAGLEIGGQRFEMVKMSKKLRKKLDGDPSCNDVLAQLFAAGGHVAYGNVVLKGSPFNVNAENLESRVRLMSAVADLID
jgi:hypothetical protein